MTAQLRTPVVLIVFKRPDVTRRALESIRQARPERLFVVADGPRPDRTDEARLCGQVRELIDEVVDWPCRIERKFADSNLGLEANVELGLDWVFEQVDRAIVLEDDCIPDASFFPYCEELLDRYAAVPEVWQIAGDNEGVPEEMFGGCSYAFSTWASVWGWATWADRWHAHRAVFDRDHAGAEQRYDQNPRTADAHRSVPTVPHPDALVTAAGLKHFTQVAGETNGDLRGWDHHWWVTIMSRCGLSAMPVVNLVENDGYGEGATHTRAAKAPLAAQRLPMPIVHPPVVALNRDVEAEMELILLRIDGRMSRWARRLIQPLWLRALVRRLITHPSVWRLVRKLVAR
ncbi:MAG TPA: hypothetical protein VFE40_03360 [Jatrophihabitantaceae bacterium]|nr:hypothetical protein [Jatrophihabitantaceae bacterium]